MVYVKKIKGSNIVIQYSQRKLIGFNDATVHIVFGIIMKALSPRR